MTGRSRVDVALPIALAVTAVLATGAAVYAIVVSNIAPHPVGQSVATVVVAMSFVVAGLVALGRWELYGRFGLLLAAVGLSSLLTVLHEANSPLVYTIGLFTSNLVWAVLVHALLAFPDGRITERRDRILAVSAYAAVLGVQAVAVLFDPLTRWHSAHPPNLALVDANAALATVLLELEASIAIVVALSVAVIRARRARRATLVARRQLNPVLWCGVAGVLVFAIGLAVAPLSSTAGLIGFGAGLLASTALPIAFVVIMLQGRLSQGAVGELLVDLRQPGRPAGLEDALRQALGDPTLQLARIRPEDGAYLDRTGAVITVGARGDMRVATSIVHQGEAVGALVHDPALRLRPELLEAVGAAAGFALANERALETLQRVERRTTALLDAIPDQMLRITRDGTYLDAREAAARDELFPGDLVIGRNVRDYLPPELADRILECIERALRTGRVSTIEYELEIGGVRRGREARMVPSGDGEIVGIVRDVTEQRRSQATLNRVLAEQEALRRVATLVAGGAAPEQVFQAVTEEVCRLLGLWTAVLHRFEGGNISTIVGKFGEPTGSFELGRVNKLEVGSALEVLRTGAPAHSDYAGLTGAGARELHVLGFSGSVGVPIAVAGRTWGALVVVLRHDEVLPPKTERRLQAFAELVALAVASAHARDELTASRRRIVEASDAERQRIERNLHDGAQQRLVTLALDLRVIRTKIVSAPEEAEERLAAAASELSAALAELRELAHGIHPAVLTEHGLEAALDALAVRAPLPVTLDVHMPERLPEQVEAAAYYVASEALANVVKHAQAETVTVRARRDEDYAVIEIEDDGVGGADPDGGTGLCGLRDRVEALAGTLEIESAPGSTLIRAGLPVPARTLEEVGRSG